MKLLKPTLALLLAGSFLEFCPVACASYGFSGTFSSGGYDTYEFTASSGPTYLNGSTVTIYDNSGADSVVGWDVVDDNPAIGYTVTLDNSLYSATSFSAGALTGGGLLTAGNITSATATTFTGSFTITNSAVISGTFYNEIFNGTGASLDDSILTDVDPFGPITVITDPPGTWTFDYSTPAPSAPDAAATFALLLTAAGAMEVYRRLSSHLFEHKTGGWA